MAHGLRKWAVAGGLLACSGLVGCTHDQAKPVGPQPQPKLNSIGAGLPANGGRPGGYPTTGYQPAGQGMGAATAPTGGYGTPPTGLTRTPSAGAYAGQGAQAAGGLGSPTVPGNYGVGGPLPGAQPVAPSQYTPSLGGPVSSFPAEPAARTVPGSPAYNPPAPHLDAGTAPLPPPAPPGLSPNVGPAGGGFGPPIGPGGSPPLPPSGTPPHLRN